MGEVWRARHRLLARPAAIKLIRPTLLGASDRPRPRARCGVRARGAGRPPQLRSPHTVDLFDFGVADDGAFYYVMELLDGLDLDTLVQRLRPAAGRARRHLLRQVCHSLAEAEAHGSRASRHQAGEYLRLPLRRRPRLRQGAGLRHRQGRARATPPGARMSDRRRTMSCEGTPAFIAPEQALGADDDRRPRRHLRARLRRLLAADRTARVHRRHDDRRDDAPRAHRAGAALAAARSYPCLRTWTN